MIQSTQVPRSRVIHLGSDSSRCGYCRRSDGSHNYAVWALRLHVEDYQELLDAGWRRSGNYLYRPHLDNTCCPPYVIRLDASNFKPSSTHKRVLKRLRHASTSTAVNQPQVQKDNRKDRWKQATQPLSAASDHKLGVIRAAISEAAQKFVSSSHLNPALRVEHVQDALSKFKVFPPRQPAKKTASDPNRRGCGRERSIHADGREGTRQRDDVPNSVSNIALVLAAAERKGSTTPSSQCDDPSKRQMHIADAFQRMLRQNQSVCDVSAVGVTYPGFLNFWWNPPEEPSYGDTRKPEHENDRRRSSGSRRSSDTLFHVKQIHPLPAVTERNWRAKRSSVLKSIDVSDVSELDVMSDIDHGQTSNPSPASTKSSLPDAKQPPLQSRGEESNASNFAMQMVPSEFREESYELFRRYQMSIHDERASQCSRDIYTRFLVDSPLTRYQSASNDEERYGSYHFLYRIGGRLFAVGVVDVLPRCLSSVYLFYDPDFAKLSPGTLSALKEIDWIKSVSHVYPYLRYYYMGYYIHSCPKMRYKASFNPSQLLCEVSKNWVPVSEARRVLDSIGERALRLAPPEMVPAPVASYFQFDEEEMERLTDEAILHVGNADDEVMKMLSFKSLRETLGSRCPEQVSTIRSGIEAFLRHVGKRNSCYYIHML
ncbi:Arginyltransferase [Gracilaria domingensis]|nr:Arginyltransferase [Gracilaria domingensis]